MKITLAQAIQLSSQLDKDVHKSKMALITEGIITFEHGQPYETTDKVNIVYAELQTLMDHIFELKSKIMQTNMVTTVDYELNGHTLNVYEAITLVKQYREIIERLESLSMIPEKPRLERNFTESCYKVANFNVSDYAKELKKYKRMANRLSTEIDKVNYTQLIDVDWADEYIG